MKLKSIFYKTVGATGLLFMAMPSAFAVAPLPTTNGQAGSASTILGNAGKFATDLGTFTIRIAALIGLVLFMAGLIKANKHFIQQGGQQESVMGPVVMIIIGLSLMSLVIIKAAATTTIFGTNTAVKFNQTTGGGGGAGFQGF